MRETFCSQALTCLRCGVIIVTLKDLNICHVHSQNWYVSLSLFFKTKLSLPSSFFTYFRRTANSPIFGCLKQPFKVKSWALNLVSLVAVISFAQERSVNKAGPPPVRERYLSELKFHTSLLCPITLLSLPS